VAADHEETGMSALQDQSLPEFAVAMRGYDRLQVDEYIERLNRWLEEAQTRMGEAEARAAELESEVMALRQRVAAMEDEHVQSTDPSLDAVASRVRRMLDEALADCEAIRGKARQEAEASVKYARETATEIVSRAQRSIADMVKETRADRDEASDGVLSQARQRAQEIEKEAAMRKAAAADEVRALEQRRAEVLAEMTKLRGALEGWVGGDVKEFDLQTGADSARVGTVEVPMPSD
jgi:cell division septum initiation protein DivIVA